MVVYLIYMKQEIQKKEDRKVDKFYHLCNIFTEKKNSKLKLHEGK